MSKFLVIITAEVEADDPRAAYDEAMASLDRYPARVWSVPESLDDDPTLTEVTPSSRRTWTLPPEPGPEVTAVRNDEGATWDRRPSQGLWSSENYWQRRTGDPNLVSGMLSWGALIVFQERLTDATEEEQ